MFVLYVTHPHCKRGIPGLGLCSCDHHLHGGDNLVIILDERLKEAI
jgi:hypothetical protein